MFDYYLPLKNQKLFMVQPCVCVCVCVLNTNLSEDRQCGTLSHEFLFCFIIVLFHFVLLLSYSIVEKL